MKDNGEIDAILEVLLTPNPLQAGRLKTSHTTRPQPRRDLSYRPRSAPYAQRSGIGPQRALEAITKIPSAQRESLSSPELPQRAQDRSRGAPHTPSGAGLGPEQALEAI